MMTTIGSLFAAVIAGGLFVAGFQTHAVDSAPAELRPAIQRGDLVIVSVQSAVLGELRARLAEHGPEHALRSCHLDSAAVAMRIAHREGVRVGRTSARLRNPRNAPPSWASDIVASHTVPQARKVDGFVVDLGDRIGLLRPIVEQPICATCHGPASRLSPAVKAEIARWYPADGATGFEEGDLRGWFWVEVPKRRVP
jgi:hypothetical protein